jgi:hypothetical protein
VVKCGVCGSDNEPEALFCGTCGSALSPAAGKAIADEADQTATTSSDDVVVPGQGGSRRERLATGGEPGTGDETIVDGPTGGGGGTEPVIHKVDTSGGGPTIVCQVCGTVNDATRVYCRKCANELRPAAPPPPPPPPPDGGRRLSPLVIGLGAAAVLGAVGILILAIGLGGKPAQTSSPTALATPGASEPVSTPEVSEPGATEPAFSEGDPSGQMVFARCPPEARCVLYSINADGSGLDALTDPADGSATDPGFSNDGGRVVYASSTGLRILDIESGKWTQHSTTRGDTNGFWSPDDSMITFSGHRDRDPGSDDDDLEIRLDGVTVPGDSEPLTANAIVDHDPVFTPDGKSIIWVEGEGDERELKLIDLESRDVTQLTNDEFDDVDPAVSPDGTKLVFASKRDAGDTFDLFLMDLATLEITPLPKMPGDEHDASWSPGGRYLVFSAGEQADQKSLHILDLADGSIDELTSPEGRDLAPAWR